MSEPSFNTNTKISFKREDKPSVHIREPIEENTYECSTCGKILKNKAGLKSHENKHRPNLNDYYKSDVMSILIPQGGGREIYDSKNNIFILPIKFKLPEGFKVAKVERFGQTKQIDGRHHAVISALLVRDDK